MTTLDQPSDDPADARWDTIPFAYIRLYTGEDGQSHLEDVTLRGVTRGVDESDLRATFSAAIPVDWMVFRHVLEEASGEVPHNAPRRQFIVQLRGECVVEASDGDTRRLVPGSVLLVEDVDGCGHVTKRLGLDDRTTLLIPLRDGPEPEG